MIDWIRAQGKYHAVVDGSAVCGELIGGTFAADHPCEVCVGALYRMVGNVPGLEADDQ